MREYKFRGRDEHGVWHYGYFANIRLQSVPRWDSPTVIRFAEIVDEDDLTNRVDPETVGQYTGLKDAKGKEIYEGDIVSWGDGTPPTSVRWDEHFAYYVIMESLILSYACKAVRVIGNIHDNPELLK